MPLLSRTVLILPLLVTACAHPPPPAPSLPPVLIAFRDATGGAAWDRVQAIERRATISVGGMTGTHELVEDVVSGRHRTTIAIGTITEAEGWNGSTGWERGEGGEVATVDEPSAVAAARTTAWLTRRGYFCTGSATYRDLGTRDRFHIVEATPVGGAPVALWFDARGMLARTVEHQGTVTTELSDYRAIAGVAVPFRLTIDQGDPRNQLAIAVTDIHVVAMPDASVFAAPKIDPDRVTFANSATSAQVSFELINNHIYIRATIDGQPVRLIVDTGGQNMLTPASARRLGIATEGKLAEQGAGADKADLGYGHARRLANGEVTLADPVFAVVDPGKLSEIEGEDLDGLVGFELLSRLRARIDYPARTLTLTAAEAFKPPGGAIAVPFTMTGNIPIVDGAIDGVPGRLWIDTGTRGSLTTMAKFTRDHDLVAKYQPRFETVSGWGIGGSVRTSPVRFHEVALGGAALRDVVGELFTGDKGAFADPDAADNVAGGILRRFVVTFDYAARIMYLEPVAHPEPRDSYDRSGMFLRRDGDALAVISVVPHGPAETAGIAPEDRITSIDGAPVRSKPLAAWRAALRDRAPGTKLRVHVERAGAVILVLTELVP
jgi:hypothetical protein